MPPLLSEIMAISLGFTEHRVSYKIFTEYIKDSLHYCSNSFARLLAYRVTIFSVLPLLRPLRFLSLAHNIGYHNTNLREKLFLPLPVGFCWLKEDKHPRKHLVLDTTQGILMVR